MFLCQRESIKSPSPCRPAGQPPNFFKQMSSPNARPIGGPSDFTGNHVVSINQFTSRASVEYLCDVAELMGKIVEGSGGCELLKHRVLANVFYEPSTRTSCSFASAMQRLGGSVLQVSESTSSAAKGETLGDSVKALACYSDAVVLRHPAKGSALEASIACPVPLLNAGDGVGEHPTQALLDYATIRRELGRVEGLTVTLVGDLKNGRTVHSLARLLALCAVSKLNYVAPREWRVCTFSAFLPLMLENLTIFFVTFFGCISRTFHARFDTRGGSSSGDFTRIIRYVRCCAFLNGRSLRDEGAEREVFGSRRV